MSSLTPTQEHFLKRELLRLQLEKEFEQFNDAYALRRFGFPFTKGDPEEYKVKKKSKSDGVITADADDTLDEFPLSKFFFNNFVLTIPFLSSQHQNIEEFWIKKVQRFYEHFMNLSMSESYDRDELTKRKKLGLKLTRFILMFYNSGVGTTNEAIYYQKEKQTIGESAQSSKLDKLMFPSKETLQEHVANGTFINGVNVNVAGVRLAKKANNKFWSTLNITKTHDTYYEFLIKSRVELSESSNIYVPRRYQDFKELHQLLKKKYPGKQLPKLPSKIKSVIHVGGSSVDDDEDDPEYYEDDEDDINSKKHDDEIRRSLTSLFKDLKIEQPPANSDPNPQTPKLDTTSQFDEKTPKSPKSPKSSKFFKSPGAKMFGSPSSSEKKKTSSVNGPDGTVKNKLPREKLRVALRAYIRELLKDEEIAHCEILKEFLFKGQILKLSNEEEIDIKIRENLDLLLLLNQVKFQSEAYARVTELKKQTIPLRTKLLESDNGIIDIFDELKTKDHISQLSPMLRNFMDWCKIEVAATIYQLFLGNDSSFEFYSQIRRFHKMLPYSVMINILKFTNPMSIMKMMLDLMMASPFGGKSLLQTLFYGILTDDIKAQMKTITELEAKIGHQDILKRLKFFVYDCEDKQLLESIKQESKELNTDLLLTIIITPKLSDQFSIDDETVGIVFESYQEYKKIKTAVYAEDKVLINHEKTEFYSNMKAIFKLYVKNHDKDILKQIWSEPELTSILKDLLTMFYQPLVNLFKNAHVEIAFKNFENFMDELIVTIDRLQNEIYISDTSKIVDEIMKVLNNHEDEFYQFLHNVYKNDSDQIFEQLIQWINKVLNFLRNSKDLNSTGHKKLDITSIVSDAPNGAVILEELEAIIETVRLQRQQYMEKLAKNDKKQQDLINKNWDMINNVEIFNSSDFGLNEHDILELNEEETSDDEDEDDVKITPREEMKTDEIATLVPVFKAGIVNILQ